MTKITDLTKQDTSANDVVTKTFEELWLREWVLRGLEKAGYTAPTAIQEQVIDRFVHGNHIVGQSQTGTGKTGAFVIPLINAIDPKSRKLQAIIMSPTRELVVQTEEEFYKLAWGSPGFKSAAAYGGGSKYRQLSQLERGAQVLVATPGRLLDYMSKGKINTEDIKYFVLDEADRMLDMGFQDDIEDIINACPNITQMMSFSATITPELNQIITRYVGKEYDFIKTTAEIVVDRVDHSFIHVANVDKLDLLNKYLKEYEDRKVLIFTQTKMSADDVAQQLHQMWHKVAAIHGDIDQRHRMRTIKDLKWDYLKILVATDVAARGLNLNDIELVVNFEVPQDPESYIHRIGRTARAGKSGQAITFADNRELQSLRVIERRNKLIIKQIDEHGVEVARRIIDGMRSGGGSSRGRNGRWGGGGGSRWPVRTGRFDDRGGSSSRGGDRGGDRWGYAPRSDRGGYGSDNRRSSYGSNRWADRGWDRGGDRGGYAPRSDRAPSDRGGSRFGGWASRGGDRGGFSRPPRRDDGYRPRDEREAVARSGDYGTPPSKKPDVMFEPRKEYY